VISLPHFLDSSINVNRNRFGGRAKEVTKEQSLTEGEKKSIALQKIMSEQDELKLLLKKKQEEELQITSGAQRRHSSQSKHSKPTVLPDSSSRSPAPRLNTPYGNAESFGAEAHSQQLVTIPLCC